MGSRSAELDLDTKFGFFDSSTFSRQIYNPLLISNSDEETMLKTILHELNRSTSFVFSVAFITPSGLNYLKQAMLDFEGEGTIITSTYLDFNDPDVFEELLEIPNLEVLIHDDPKYPFHAKGYIFYQPDGVTAIVGSSNLTRNALIVNNEWNLRFSAMPDGDITDQLTTTVEKQRKYSKPLSPAWIDDYASRRKPQLREPDLGGLDETNLPVGRIVPNAMQQAALTEINKVWEQDEHRAVVISATGTGKTILAALAVREIQPERLLFVVHREQILDKARTEFQRVLEASPDNFGKFVGQTRQIDREYVFSTIQTLSKPETLESIDPEHFDFIIIDEVHRAGAKSYQRIINHFTPERLLGLTATPERTDGFNIFELFDFNVPYEIRLQEALEENMLVPFNYFGVTDFIDEHGETVEKTSRLARLTNPDRLNHLLEKIELYGHKSNVRGLMFCSSTEEARELSSLLNQRAVNGRELRTYVLTGDSSMIEREDTVAKLERGELDYILTVDIFNEGIDIPSVNQVVLLRSTQSSIIFTQQLGRGLRKHKNKDHLRVIDFIGNYSNNFLIPIALFGDNSCNRYSVRRKMIKASTQGSIAGVSSVNFDKISRARVLESLNKAKLDSMASLKSAYRELKHRLGGVPRRIDFARFGTIDPVIICTSSVLKGKDRNYWGFVNKVDSKEPCGEAERLPNREEGTRLAFLDSELLNGMRPHELLLIRKLLENENVTRKSFRKLLQSEGLSHNSHVLTSVKQILSLDFYTQPDRDKFGPILDPSANGFVLDPTFASLLETSETFAQHVNDIVETGLFLARHRYSWSSEMQVGRIYTRKETTRLLNWEKTDIPQNIGGYKVDESTMTCPIFVTYNKDEGISETTKYEDAFIDPARMHWFTKSRRTLKSKQEKLIAEKEVELHLFVKKSDDDEKSFYYLGTVSPSEARDSSMPGENNQPIKVVEMTLNLDQPVSNSLYDFLTGGNAIVELPEKSDDGADFASRKRKTRH